MGGTIDTKLGLGRIDAALGAMLVGGAVLYLSCLPPDLNFYDESLFLYQAKRILNGQVPYRDYFQITMPAAWYLMALLFRLFGTTIETARGTMIVVQSLIVAGIFTACRLRGVWRAIAVPMAAAHLAFGYPLFPIATPHWFGTLLTVTLLVIFLTATGRERPRWWLLPGLVTGIFILVQQQKAVPIGAGISALLAGRAICFAWRRHGTLRRDVASLAGFGAGVMLVFVPAALVLSSLAGLGTLYKYIVVFPLTSYRGYVRTSWVSTGKALAGTRT